MEKIKRKKNENEIGNETNRDATSAMNSNKFLRVSRQFRLLNANKNFYLLAHGLFHMRIRIQPFQYYMYK